MNVAVDNNGGRRAMLVTKAVAIDGLCSIFRCCGGWLGFGSTLSRATISSLMILSSESKLTQAPSC